MINVIRARKDIRPRSIISLDVLEEVTLPDLAYDKNNIQTLGAAIGKVARNLIFQGRTIKMDDLEDNEV